MTNNMLLAIPEMSLFGLACLTLFFGSVFRHRTAGGICIVRAYWLSQLSLLATLLLVLSLPIATVSQHFAFSGSVVHDDIGRLLKIVICALGMTVFLYSREYFRKHGVIQGEYYILGLFSLLGMLVMVSAHDLLVLYMGLELSSLALYSMIAMQAKPRLATEAAVKYFFLGAVASGILLYGMSLLYGVTGSLNLSEIHAYIMGNEAARPWLIYATVFIIVGLAFKLGAAPFHMWIPDVYQGAPTMVTLFIASAPKIAAFAAALRLLADGLWPLIYDWRHMLLCLAVLSIVWGNSVAIMQNQLKRMLAYSAIAHTGFILIGIGVGSAQGFAGAMFYTVVHAIMSTGVFGLLILCARRGGSELDELQDCKGLARRRPWFALVMLCFMFSMIGIPPLAGFWAKWFVLSAAVSEGYVWLAALAVLFSVIGAFYYLRIIKFMYFDDPVFIPRLSGRREGSPTMQWVLSVNGVLILLLGLFPGPLLQICSDAIHF